MSRTVARLRLSAVVAVSLSVGGCLLLTPLEDFENGTASEARSGGGGSAGLGGEGGGAGTSMSGEGGAPESTAGEAGAVGMSGGEGGVSAPNGGQAGAEPTGCRSNLECITNGAGDPYRCRPDGECARLRTSECPLVYGNFRSPNAIYIGSFAPLPEDRPDSSTVVHAEVLALEEIAGDTVGGLPDADGISHPIVMVVCDNSGEEETLKQQVLDGMAHLADTVQVPAVLAMLLPGDMRDIFQTYGSRDIFYLNPVGTTRQIVDLDDNDLIWNLLGQPSDLAPVYGELVRLLELHIRTQRSMTPSDPVRVALVTTSDAFNDELATYVERELEFNGERAIDNDAANYRVFTVKVSDPTPEQTASAIGDAVRAFGPDLVISAAGKEFTQVQGVLQRIELEWQGTHGTMTPRPFQLLSPFNAGDIDAIRDLIAAELGIGGTVTDATAHQRFVGIAAAGALDTSLQTDYARRLQTKFGSVSSDTGNYYDAFYYLAYAMYGAGPGTDLTGPAILGGLNRLLAGPAREVGPDHINTIFADLAPRSSTIELIGTLGPPDFNLDGGIRVDPGSVFCFAYDGGSEVEPEVDVLRYDKTSGEFEGDFPCFPGFPPSEP